MFKRIALLCALLSISPLALAHFPLMQCTSSDGKLACQAGYSDGSRAVGYEVKLYDYDDNLLAVSVTDKRSIAEFTMPNGDYYLVFDAGHESPVEVDGVEVKAK